MLRFRLQGQVHFLRARIKGVADELTPARHLVAVTLTRFTDANAVKRDKIQNRKPSRNGRGEWESDAATVVPSSCCCGNYSTDTNIQLASSFSLYLNKVWLNSI